MKLVPRLRLPTIHFRLAEAPQNGWCNTSPGDGEQPTCPCHRSDARRIVVPFQADLDHGVSFEINGTHLADGLRPAIAMVNQGIAIT